MKRVRVASTVLLMSLTGVAWLSLAQPELGVSPGSEPVAGVPASASSSPLTSFAQLTKRVAPSVVMLTTPNWLGSGFIVDRSGLVVTNAHVVEKQSNISVHLSDGSQYPVTVIGTDQATDIALVKIVAQRSFPAVALGNDRNVQVGDWVLAIGSPDGLTGTVTAGIVSAIHRDKFSGARIFTDYLQIDAAINHGNSGGPTFDMQGRVIGMNTLGSYLSSNCSGNLCERNDGIGFSIPVSTIRMVIDDLKAGPVKRSVVGILVEEVTADVAKALGLKTPKGALVSDVVYKSPADLAGIKPGDVVLKINNHVVRDDRDCLRQTAALDAGTKAKFGLWRDGKELSVVADVIERANIIDLTPGNDAQISTDLVMSALGLAFQLPSVPTQQNSPFQSHLQSDGLVVSAVNPTSDAAARGFHVGDRVLRVGSMDVRSLADITAALQAARAQQREYVILYVMSRLGGKSYVAVKLGTS